MLTEFWRLGWPPGQGITTFSDGLVSVGCLAIADRWAMLRAVAAHDFEKSLSQVGAGPFPLRLKGVLNSLST